MTDDRSFEAEIRELEPQHTVCARVTTTTDALGEVFSSVPTTVLSRIQEAGAQPGGALFARYHAFTPERVDVEIGFPVSEPPPGVPALAEVARGEVGTSSLPDGSVASTIYRGTYDGLPAIYDQLHDWIHAAGHEEGAGPWEAYIDDPGDMSDMSNVRTEICWPLG